MPPASVADPVSVVLDPAHMADARSWAEAVRRNGFDLRIDPGFDERTHAAYVPCVYRGRPAGFDYRYELDAGGKVRVTLGARENPDEIVCSSIVAAVLCALADGTLRDPANGDIIAGADAIAWARRQDARLAGRPARRPDPPRPYGCSFSKAVGVNLAIAYAVAGIVTTYTAPPNDLTSLLVGPFILVSISAIFGLATVAVVARLRRTAIRRFRPMAVWLAGTWAAVILSLLDPFLQAPPLPTDRAQPSVEEVRSGLVVR